MRRSAHSRNFYQLKQPSHSSNLQQFKQPPATQQLKQLLTTQATSNNSSNFHQCHQLPSAAQLQGNAPVIDCDTNHHYPCKPGQRRLEARRTSAFSALHLLGRLAITVRLKLSLLPLSHGLPRCHVPSCTVDHCKSRTAFYIDVITNCQSSSSLLRGTHNSPPTFEG